MTVLTEPVRIHDLLLHEYDQRYVRKSVTFRNATGGSLEFKIGQTLKLNAAKYEPCDGATAVNAILLKNLGTVANLTDVLNVPVLIRGPALINKAELRYIAGANIASQEASIEAGVSMTPPCILVAEPVQQTNG